MNFQPRKLVVKENNQLAVTVESVMSKRFVWVQASAHIESAIEKILKSNQTGAPVLNKNKEPVGFLSQKDCLKLATQLRYFNSYPGYVSDYMTQNVEVLQGTNKLFDAINCFIDKWYHAYPVVNPNNQVIGLLTRKKVLEYVKSINQTSWYSGRERTFF